MPLDAENGFTFTDLHPFVISEGVMPGAALFSDSIESIRAVEDVGSFAVLGFHYAASVPLAFDTGPVAVDPPLLTAVAAALYRARSYDAIHRQD